MTRLLAPEMFGIASIGLLLITVITQLSDVGLKQVVIQSDQGSRQEFLNTVWTLQALRGVGIFLVCLLLAGCLSLAQAADAIPAGSTFSENDLPLVIAAVATTALIAGLEPTRLLTANRELQLGRVVAIELVSQLLAFLSMVAIATFTRTIWVLVAGAIAAACIRVALAYWLLPGDRNRFRWDTEEIRRVLNFGKWIFLSSIVGIVYSSGDRLMLGALFSAEVLGQYAIAVLLLGALKEIIQRLLSSVAFPAFSELARTRPGELAAKHHRLRIPVDAVTLTLLGFLSIAGSSIVDLLYDSRYADAGRYLEILAWSFFGVRFAVSGHLYIAMGRPAVLYKLIAVDAIALYCLVPLGFAAGGIEGAVWGVALSSFASVPFVLLMNSREGLLKIGYEALVLLYIPVGALAGQLTTRVLELL